MITWFRMLGWRVQVPVVLIALGILFYVGAMVAASADYLPFNTYSDGWRMGLLSKVSLKGNPLFKSVEAEVLMGNDSSATATKSGEPELFANPWAFSAPSSEEFRLIQVSGKSVAVHYRQVKVQLTNINGDTDYRVVEVQPMDPAAAPKGCGVDSSSGSTKSDGQRVGLLTKVSDRGNWLKSWEVLMQLGNAGNQFLAMSILDGDINNCALDFLKSGVRVRVVYKQSLIRNPASRDTSYNIIGIWPSPKDS